MNRKQRRAALKQQKPAGSTRPPAAAAADLFAQALRHQHYNQLDDAVRIYKRLLAQIPDHAEAWNNFGCVLRAQGKPKEAESAFRRSLTLLPQLLDDYSSIAALLVSVNPALDEGMKRADAAWPQRLPPDDLLGGAGIAALASDMLLRHVLLSTTVRNVALERLMTSLRTSALRAASDGDAKSDESLVEFCSTLARQCFINEYVFATTPEEITQLERLRDAIANAVASGSPIASIWLAAVAMYQPLLALPDALALLDRAWPPPLAEVLTQQVREPQQERQLRDTIPRLTTIDDDVSVRVRQQYEENPYPRWVYTAAAQEVSTIDEYLRFRFPTSAFRPLGKNDGLDILVAGCGTGRHPIEVAQRYKGARVLAVDLSLTSLCYAKRKTPPVAADRIEYAQADILKLPSIDKTFDLIEASGVLHHMSDPLGGWHALLTLLRPGGFMRLGFYSEFARRDVVAARAFIAERGYRPTDDDIRRCRQDLLSSPLKTVARSGDFFSTSDCRDLLFHVQESRLTLPQINSFIVEHSLKFIGFVFGPQSLVHYRARFAAAGWSMQDIDRWHAFETENPDTFAGMYQFWVQKT